MNWSLYVKTIGRFYKVAVFILEARHRIGFRLNLDWINHGKCVSCWGGIEERICSLLVRHSKTKCTLFFLLLSKKKQHKLKLPCQKICQHPTCDFRTAQNPNIQFKIPLLMPSWSLIDCSCIISVIQRKAGNIVMQSTIYKCIINDYQPINHLINLYLHSATFTTKVISWH